MTFSKKLRETHRNYESLVPNTFTKISFMGDFNSKLERNCNQWHHGVCVQAVGPSNNFSGLFLFSQYRMALRPPKHLNIL